MSEANQWYVPMVMVPLSSIKAGPFEVAGDKGQVGFICVYASYEAAREAWPDAVIQRVRLGAETPHVGSEAGHE